MTAFHINNQIYNLDHLSYAEIHKDGSISAYFCRGFEYKDEPESLFLDSREAVIFLTCLRNNCNYTHVPAPPTDQQG